MNKKTRERPTAKVLIRNGAGFDETLWAFALGNDVYRLDNSPFFTYGVSYQDEVIAKPKNEGGIPEFVRIRRKSGNRTLRVAGYKGVNRGHVPEQVIQDLEALGCSIKGVSRKYISVNIPPPADLQQVVGYLIRQNQRWEYADPTFEEVHGSGMAKKQRRK